jgi:hypothetical protein
VRRPGNESPPHAPQNPVVPDEVMPQGRYHSSE